MCIKSFEQSPFHGYFGQKVLNGHHRHSQTVMYATIQRMQSPAKRRRHIIHSKEFGAALITPVDRFPSAFLRSLHSLPRQLLGRFFPRERHPASACRSGACHGALLGDGVPAFPKGG
jgi:hypothetical protein